MEEKIERLTAEIIELEEKLQIERDKNEALEKENGELKYHIEQVEEMRDGYDQDRQNYRAVLLKLQEDINWIV